MSNPPASPSDLPTILSVHLGSEDEGVSIFCNPIPLLEREGTDPAQWAPILAAVVNTISRAHSSCLVEEGSGDNPDPAIIYDRIMEVLDDTIRQYADEEPTVRPEPSGAPE